VNFKAFIFASAFAVTAQFFNVTPSLAVPVEIGTNYFDSSGSPVAAPSGSISIEETFDVNTGQGSYTVFNGTSFVLQGFGVSNIDSIASVGDFFSTSLEGQFFDYTALTLTDGPDTGNWQTAEVFFFGDGAGQTFQEIFGNFEDNVAPGENTINWYTAGEIGLAGNDGSIDGYFLFQNLLGAASVGLGVLNSSNGPLFFNQGISVVPLPAALPLYGTGLALMGFIGWRRRQQKVAA